MAAEAQGGDRKLPVSTIDQIKVILETLRLEGRHWVRGISTTDWRRVHYVVSDPRSARRAGAVQQRVGPSQAELVDDNHRMRSYLMNEASSHTEAMHHYIVVKGDRQCIEDNGLALLRPVLKLDFKGRPLLNFHVWFHGLAPAGDQSHLMFGLRLEAPEGGNVHDYFHAQPLRRFGPTATCHGLPDRFPERFPTIPLHAADSVELCLNAVLIACGKDALRTIVRGSGDAAVRSSANAFWTKVFGTDVHKDADEPLTETA